nr:hypothetical protein [Saccharopolyspora pogona]
MHKNTVHYRIRKAEETIGRPAQGELTWRWHCSPSSTLCSATRT